MPRSRPSAIDGEELPPKVERRMSKQGAGMLDIRDMQGSGKADHSMRGFRTSASTPELRKMQPPTIGPGAGTPELTLVRRPLPLPLKYRPLFREVMGSQGREEPEHHVRQLNWSLPIQHVAVTCIRVQLVCSVKKTKLKLEEDHCPRCNIKVWTQGGHKGVKLFHCRGSICPKNALNALHIAWLGRAKECPGQSGSDEWRYVGRDAEPEGLPSEVGRLTMAQALLGFVVAIGELFGIGTVTLDAEDAGSGKLIQYYSKLGFEAPDRKIQGMDLRMIAPAALISKLAPQSWIQRVVPPDFDAWGWFWSDAGNQKAQDIMDKLGMPQRWAWKVAWPVGAGVDIRLRPSQHKMDLEALLRTKQGVELAFARGAVRLKQKALKVLWLGRTQAQPVHPSVRGKQVYEVGTESGEDSGRSTSKLNVTTAVALMGALAGLARWFGTTKVDLMAFDDGSGKLLSYLCNLSFDAPAAKDDSINAADPISLTASCTRVLERCCPSEWRENLPPDSQLVMLGHVCSDPG